MLLIHIITIFASSILASPTYPSQNSTTQNHTDVQLEIFHNHSISLNETFKDFMQYAAISYCPRIYETGLFECENNCGGYAAGSIMVNALNIEPIHGGGFVAYSHRNRKIYVAFRGTVNLANFLADFDLVQDPLVFNTSQALSWIRTPGDFRVHRGFYILYEALRMSIKNSIIETMNKFPDYDIIFTGHSMGGALATLAALDLYESHGVGSRISVYTFGSPRFANVELARYINSQPFQERLFRVVRRGDPVPHLPPRFAGYEHTVRQYDILETGTLLECAISIGTGESLDCLNDLKILNYKLHSDYYGFVSDC